MTDSDQMVAMVVPEPGPPAALKCRTLPKPQPVAGQVRIQVAYVGLNPVDAMLRRQRLDWLPVTYPFIPGAEHSGIIDAVGPGVDAGWIGRRVLSRRSFGGYAQFSVAPVAGLVRLDDRISLKLGCAYRGCTFTAWHALHSMGRLREGDRVLIHSAAGAIGIMAMQIATEAGATVVGLAGGSAKVEFARRYGSNIIDYLKAEWPQEAARLVRDGRFDLILDGNGGPNAAYNPELIAPLGRILYIGNTAGRFPHPFEAQQLIGGSYWVGGMTLQQIEAVVPDLTADLVEAIATGRWQIPVTETVRLSDVTRAHERLEARELCGRVVICVNDQLE